MSTRVSTRAHGDLLANKHWPRARPCTSPTLPRCIASAVCCNFGCYLNRDEERRFALRRSLTSPRDSAASFSTRFHVATSLPAARRICAPRVCLQPCWASPLTRRRKADARGPKRERIVGERGVVGTKQTSSMPSQMGRGGRGRTGVGGIHSIQRVSTGTRSVGQVSPHYSAMSGHHWSLELEAA